MTMIADNPPRSLPVGNAPLRLIRRGLDIAYLWCGYLAAACLAAIFVLTITQIVTRYAGFNLRGLTDYSGYFMAASAFLAFAHALNSGSHIRIELFVSLAGKYRAYTEVWAFGASSFIATWFAYYSCNMVWWSYKLGDISTGLDATPLWIPQLSMAFGASLFAIAMIDHFLRLVFTGAHAIPASPELE